MIFTGNMFYQSGLQNADIPPAGLEIGFYPPKTSVLTTVLNKGKKSVK